MSALFFRRCGFLQPGGTGHLPTNPFLATYFVKYFSKRCVTAPHLGDKTDFAFVAGLGMQPRLVQMIEGIPIVTFQSQRSDESYASEELATDSSERQSPPGAR